MTRIGLRGSRSTQTPAGIAKRMKGRNSTTNERRHRERARVEQQHGDERQRQRRELRAEDADRLGGPQLEEVGVAP